MNIKVVLEYDGTGFAGWQQQSRARTVEAELKAALHAISGVGHTVYAAGRTDAGAHALGQVVNFQFRGRLGVNRLAAALNATLPEDVTVVSCQEVDDEFHARYSATWRRYRYRYLDRPQRPAYERQYCWHVRGSLDVGAMSEAAAELVGKHDWSSYCSAGEAVATRLRMMREVSVRRGERFVELDLEAEGFLRGLARGIAGALAEVGMGRRPVSWPRQVLDARDRSRAPRAAPARGLTLMDISYDRAAGAAAMKRIG